MKNFSTVLCLIAAITLHTGAHAQLRSGTQIPPALQDIKRNVGSCNKDESSGPKNLTVPEIVVDLSCAISAKELQTMLGKPSTTLVDVRQALDFQSFHLDGALNLSSAELHSKPYWKKKNLVLLGNGKAERELYGECRYLKQLGYQQVKVLRGGMPIWLAQQLAVQGAAPAAAQLQRLSVEEFWSESRNIDNFILLAKEHAEIGKELPFHTVLPQVSAEAIKTVLEKRRKESKNAPLASVVMALNSGTTDAHIELMQRAILPVPLLVYVESADKARSNLLTQKSVWSAQARGPKQIPCGQ